VGSVISGTRTSCLGHSPRKTPPDDPRLVGTPARPARRAPGERGLLWPGDLDHERDPAGHVPSLDFTLQRMLRLEFGAAFVDHRVKPSVNSLSPVASPFNGEPNHLPSCEPRANPSFFARWMRAVKVSSRAALRVNSHITHREAWFRFIKPVELLMCPLGVSRQ
jgi:hypothetical protein